MGLREASVAEGSALAPQGAGIRGALRSNAVDTTAHSFDLTAWKGRFVRISVTGAANYRFADATGASLDASTEHLSAATAASTGAAIAGILPAAGCYDRVVPLPDPKSGSVFLRIAAASGTIDVSVEPA